MPAAALSPADRLLLLGRTLCKISPWGLEGGGRESRITPEMSSEHAAVLAETLASLLK